MVSHTAPHACEQSGKAESSVAPVVLLASLRNRAALRCVQLALERFSCPRLHVFVSFPLSR